jgi:hypothetical protein
MDRHRTGALAKHRIGQQGQAGDMIEMAMGQEDMIDLDQFIDVERGRASAGIEQDILIDPKARSQSFAAAYPAGTAQNL